ncbi:MAG: Crp/Fnr family transcriptional regulator [Elainellaceae cyanobacterium]
MGYSLSIQHDLSSVIEHAFQNQCSATSRPVRRVRLLSKGETIYQCGDRIEAVYYLEAGSVKLTRCTPDGRLFTFRTVAAGELFGETDLYLDAHECEACVEVDSHVVVYPRDEVMSWVAENADLAKALLHQSHLLLLMLKRRLALLTIRSARERTLEYLRERICEDLKGDSRTITFQKPLKDVAEELDISPEGFYRILSRLEADGLIHRTKRQITLLL